MSLKAKILIGYLLIGLCFGIYAANWGDLAYKGLAYNLGGGLVWPVMLFPGLGKIIGGLIMIGVVALLFIS